MLTVNVESVGEGVVLHCSGKIVRGHETSLLCSVLQQASRNVVVDLTDVYAIDAAGIGALVSLQGAGIYLELFNPTRQVREILMVTKLNSIFEIFEPQPTSETNRPMQAGRPDNHSEGFAFASSLNA
jgi:anti-anti-sigma factor